MMINPTLFFAALLMLASSGDATTPGISSPPGVSTFPAELTNKADYLDLYLSGIMFESFLEKADSRRQRWIENSSGASIPSDLLDRARVAEAAGGPFHLLAIAVDGCSDSVSTIPWLARLVARTEGLEMRIVDPEDARDVMMSHRTPDGRPATPTVLVLNNEFEKIGAFIERPAELQEWALSAKDSLEASMYLDRKIAWYDEDLGRSTIEEVVVLMEYARVPARMKGAFEDDYGSVYEIGGATWTHSVGSEMPTIYHLMEWNARERFAVVRNGADNVFAPGRFTRIDWMSLEDEDGSDEYVWAYCLTSYDASTAASARNSRPANRAAPRTGCGGHPFTRMSPVESR